MLDFLRFSDVLKGLVGNGFEFSFCCCLDTSRRWYSSGFGQVLVITIKSTKYITRKWTSRWVGSWTRHHGRLDRCTKDVVGRCSRGRCLRREFLLVPDKRTVLEVAECCIRCLVFASRALNIHRVLGSLFNCHPILCFFMNSRSVPVLGTGDHLSSG